MQKDHGDAIFEWNGVKRKPGILLHLNHSGARDSKPHPIDLLAQYLAVQDLLTLARR